MVVRNVVRSPVRAVVQSVFGEGESFHPFQLFRSGAQGAWYDPSDYSTLYQDAAGKTPVTAVEQPVRLMLDRSKGLVLGPELVTNGGFDTDSDWTKTAFAISGGVAVSDGVDGIPILQQAPFGAEAGKTYRVSLDVTTTGVQTLFIRLESLGNTYSELINNTSKTVVVYLTCGTNAASGLQVLFTNGSAGPITVDNISVRELPGNHAVAPNDASRPVLRATNRLDFDGSDDRMAAAAGGGGTTGMLFVAGINLDVVGSASTIWSDTGTNTGYRVRINASNEVELSAGNGSAYTTVTTAETLASGTNYVIAAWHDGTNLNVRLGLSGSIAQAAFATATAGTAGFTLGMDNGATSSFLNGKLYNAVYVRNFAGTLSDVNATAAYVNGTMA